MPPDDINTEELELKFNGLVNWIAHAHAAAQLALDKARELKLIIDKLQNNAQNTNRKSASDDDPRPIA